VLFARPSGNLKAVTTQRHDFASDNCAGICPEAVTALSEANRDIAASYGDDDWTRRLCDRVREIFEIECDVFLIGNGTAANALALAQLCQSFHSVICHQQAHLENDECGAVEFFTRGSKLITTPGENGKLDLREVEMALARQHELHSHKPRVISITQATELGTVYRVKEIRVIAEFAAAHSMLLHMDGARLANAIAALRCAPKEITWQAGVDVLCFGGTKNGLAAGELVIFFDKNQSAEFDYRAKQAGQLLSKMRFLAAPGLRLLENNLWLENAAQANAMAKNLADAFSRNGAEIIFPVEANAVFVRLHSDMSAKLQACGWQFYQFLAPDVYRLMCSWATDDDAIAALIDDFKEAQSCADAAA
jgi:threonine aldolase